MLTFYGFKYFPSWDIISRCHHILGRVSALGSKSHLNVLLRPHWMAVLSVYESLVSEGFFGACAQIRMVRIYMSYVPSTQYEHQRTPLKHGYGETQVNQSVLSVVAPMIRPLSSLSLYASYYGSFGYVHTSANETRWYVVLH